MRKMIEAIVSEKLFHESGVFLPGVRASDMTFVAQDARAPGRSLDASSGTADQTRSTLENLQRALRQVGQELHHVVSLLVLLPDYQDVEAVIRLLDEYFPDRQGEYPAICFLGVTGLEGGCKVRVDAIASNSSARSPILASGVPLAIGSRNHGVRVGDLVLLSGVDAGDEVGPSADALVEMGTQTAIVLDRIDAIVRSQGLSLNDVFRTFMFMSDLKVRPAYQDSRRERYRDVFKPEEFPANSGIGVKTLGDKILLRAVAIASATPAKTHVSSDKVRLTPSLFSQSVRVGDWLFLAGQDSIGLDHQTIGIDDVEEQTAVSLTHVKDVVEAAGGSLNDVVKTTVYLVEGQDRSRFVSRYRRFFETHTRDNWTPAGLTLGVKELAPGCLVEIDAVAYLGPRE